MELYTKYDALVDELSQHNKRLKDTVKITLGLHFLIVYKQDENNKPLLNPLFTTDSLTEAIEELDYHNLLEDEEVD